LAKVDPFVIQWPNQWLEDPEIEPVIRYLNRFLHDLWIRTGGGFDDTLALKEGLRQFEDLPATEFIPKERQRITTAINYSTLENDVVICTADLTIFLNDTPDDKELVTINSGNNQITINGNSKTISGETEVIIRRRSSGLPISLDMQYFVENDAWFLI